MKNISRAVFGAALILALAAGVCPRTTLQQTKQEGHLEWVSQSLTRMRTVRPGMTRADLLKVFTTEGGLSTRVWRTYVYRECPLFKVDVEFTAAGRVARDREGRFLSGEDDRDLIKAISRPYIALTVAD